MTSKVPKSCKTTSRKTLEPIGEHPTDHLGSCAFRRTTRRKRDFNIGWVNSIDGRSQRCSNNAYNTQTGLRGTRELPVSTTDPRRVVIRDSLLWAHDQRITASLMRSPRVKIRGREVKEPERRREIEVEHSL